DMNAANSKPTADSAPPPDNPPQKPATEPPPSLAAWVAEQRAELDRQAAAIKAELESQRQAARERALAEDAMACLSQAKAMLEKGQVKAAALMDGDPGFVP